MKIGFIKYCSQLSLSLGTFAPSYFRAGVQECVQGEVLINNQNSLQEHLHVTNQEGVADLIILVGDKLTSCQHISMRTRMSK